jgi:hypothetical protein
MRAPNIIPDIWSLVFQFVRFLPGSFLVYIPEFNYPEMLYS